jgi:hypothetical protein
VKEALKLCPFCGKKAVIKRSGAQWSAGCWNDGKCYVVPFSGWHDTKEVAVDIWNTRVSKH